MPSPKPTAKRLTPSGRLASAVRLPEAHIVAAVLMVRTAAWRGDTDAALAAARLALQHAEDMATALREAIQVVESERMLTAHHAMTGA